MPSQEVSYRFDTSEGTPRASSRDSGAVGLHDTNLFDQDESAAGELIDPMTGLPHDNSSATDETHFQTHDNGFVLDPMSTDPGSEDLMGRPDPEFDAAAKWLLDNESHSSGVSRSDDATERHTA